MTPGSGDMKAKLWEVIWGFGGELELSATMKSNVDHSTG